MRVVQANNQGEREWGVEAHGGTSTPAVSSFQDCRVRWPAAGVGSGGGLHGGGVVEQRLVGTQERTDAGDRVLPVDRRLTLAGDADGVAHHEELVALVVVRRLDLARGEAELAGDGVGDRRVADDQRPVVRVQDVLVLLEDRGHDGVAVVAVHRDELGVLVTDEAEGREDEAVRELVLVGRDVLVVMVRRPQASHLALLGLHQGVLADAHGAVAGGDDDAAGLARLDLPDGGDSADHPVGDAAGDDDGLEVLGELDGGVEERAGDRVGDAGAVQPVDADLVGVGAETVRGELDVVLERLVRRDDTDDVAEDLAGRGQQLAGAGTVLVVAGEFVLERGRDLLQHTAAKLEEQTGVFCELAEAVATEVGHDVIPFLGF